MPSCNYYEDGTIRHMWFCEPGGEIRLGQPCACFANVPYPASDSALGVEGGGAEGGSGGGREGRPTPDGADDE